MMVWVRSILRWVSQEAANVDTPPINEPIRGFGSAILLEGAEQFGTVAIEYLPDGLIYQLRLDLKAIEVLKNVTTVPNKPNVVVRENI
jgi:hypothetical protein